jgi:hypothetical protein
VLFVPRLQSYPYHYGGGLRFPDPGELCLESSTELSVLGLTVCSYEVKLTLSCKEGIKDITLFRQQERILHTTHMAYKEQSDE